MRLVLANHGFAASGGTEVYLLTVAEHLQRLGHEVTIYAHELGPFAAHARNCGVAVHDALDELPDECDALLTQDAVVAYELAERYPNARHVFRTCSDVFDFELPPQLDGVVDTILVASERYARLVRGCAARAPLLRLRVPIDVDRLAPRGSLRARPQRAVLLGNYADRHALVREAWEPHGIEVVTVGGREQRYDVATALAGADIVVAKARAALDAMACGRAVYVFDCFGGDGWVTPERYPALEADNFAGQATDRVIDSATLARDLAAYDPAMGMANRDLVLQHHGAREHALALVDAIEELRPAARPAVPLRELGRLTDLLWSADRQVRWLQGAQHGLQEQLALVEADRSRLAYEAHAAADETRARVAELEAEIAAMRDTRAWRTAARVWRLKARIPRVRAS
jgi:hypothetical protein